MPTQASLSPTAAGAPTAARTIGFWSALATTLGGVLYFLVVLGAILTGHFTFPPPEGIQLFGGIISLVACPLVVIMMASLHTVTPPGRKVFSQISLGFTLLFALAVSINRFSQLGVVRQSSAIQGVGWFLAYGDHSIMLGIEYLGWAWFLGLALLCVAPLFAGGRLQAWLRWTAVVYGVLALAGALGFLAASPLAMLGFVAWGFVLFVFSGLLAVHFRSLRVL
ncbi:MAG TPA: hypothetical protein PLJ35_12935 [Anaerolineae bacterium]|nr:hypothetical protein [Anaerolineae bacterium]HOQ99718.1 hypothetical protein [Anaerolineae bacterium]HPL26637.1 hypothetical protein [Anaerolineae bacterium]